MTTGSSPPAARAVVEPRPARGPVTLAFAGDIAMGRTPVLPPAGGAELFRGVRRPLAADITLGNLEGTLTLAGTPRCSGVPDCFTFRTPPAYGGRLAEAGFTVLNLANNHAYDFGAEGQRQTLAALRRYRLGSTGRPGQITVVRVGRTRVALLGFAPHEWASDLRDIEGAVRLVRRAARRADLVVVTMHAGAEGSDHAHVQPGDEWYLGESRGNTVAFAHSVVRAGADLVVGHGPHVVRGLEWYGGRLIAYSLGNFAAYQTLSTAGVLGVGAVLRVRLRADGGWLRGSLVPIRLVGTGTPVVDPSREALTLTRSLSQADFGARAIRVGAGGKLRPPTRTRG